MRLRTPMAAAFLGLLGIALAFPGAAEAAPATGVDEVVASLGLTSEPADYVVLVDTSSSMKAGGRYTRVRNEFASLVAGLDTDDRVSLYTFDSSSRQRFRGVIGKSPAQVTAALPAQATGDHTDIGKAVEAGLTVLERSDTRRLAAIILITDGKLDAPGSKYADADAAAWKQLKTRATALNGAHQVAAYAVSLQATTDAGLLKSVFPQAREVSAAQVGKQFAQVGNDLTRLQAADVLKKELAKPVEVRWTGDLAAALDSGAPVQGSIQFESLYEHVPVELSGIAVAAPDGLNVQVAGLPARVSLKPGGQVTVPVTFSVSGSPGAGARVGLTATVSSAWQKALVTDLGLEFTPALEGVGVVPAPPIKLPPTLLPTIGAAVAGLLALLVLFQLVRMLLTPSMTGLLSFRKDGRELADVVLHGHRMKVVAPDAAADLAGLAGVASGARAATRGERAVRVDVRFGATGAKGVIPDGGVIPMGDVEIAYTSGRRRILDKIRFPGNDVPAE